MASFLGRAAQKERGNERQANRATSVAIGVVLPLPNATSRLDPDSEVFAGEAARRGARMAEEDFGNSVDSSGSELQVFVSTAPNAEAAFRAGQRLATVEGISALIGGFGLEQARALARVAQQEELAFLNIGSASDALRNVQAPANTLHVEVGASTYLTALVTAYARKGSARWFLISGNDDEGQALRRAARSAISSNGGREAGDYVLSSLADQPAALDAIAAADPDVVLLLQGWRGQLDFLGHYEARGLPQPVTGFPDPVSQTRDFLASAVRAAPGAGRAARVSLWEADSHPDAYALGERFFARWGVPMDPSAWAAYVSVMLLAAAVQDGGSDHGLDLVDWLSCRRGLNVYKGSAAHFGSDRQLYQPLYQVRPDADAREPRETVRVLGEIPTDPDWLGEAATCPDRPVGNRR